MRRITVPILALMLLSGCAATMNTVVTEELDSAGNVVKRTTTTMSNEARFGYDQAESRKNVKPLVYMKARKGETITLAGVEEFAVYGEAATQLTGFARYKSQWLQGVEAIGAPLVNLGIVGLSGYFNNENLKTVTGALSGMTTYKIDNSFNPSGQGSTTFMPGNQMNNGATVGTTPSYTDSHDDNSDNSDHSSTGGEEAAPAE